MFLYAHALARNAERTDDLRLTVARMWFDKQWGK